MNFKKGKQLKKTSAIYSAALQDHLMKKFNYNLDMDFNKTDKQPPRRKTLTKLPSIQNKVVSQIKKLEIQQKKSILPYESDYLKKLKQSKSDNQKMNAYSKKLTWAQKLGIVQAPPLPLTSKDWQLIQQKSKARNDSDTMCSICLQDFKIDPQVILSCSHVFHMKCLCAYQKHNKVKCCPICRRKDYQKKIIDQAIRAFTIKSILRIQRVFRGSQDRIKLFSRLVQSEYKANSVRFNRRIIGFKMWRLSKKVSENIKKKNQFYLQKIKSMEEFHNKQKENILDQMIEVQRKKITDQKLIQKYLEQLGIKKQQKKQEKDWNAFLKKAVERSDHQCSICLMKLWGKPVYLLSCTHLFHVNCIQSFERYAIPGNQNKCPCCRSSYDKRQIKQNQK